MPPRRLRVRAFAKINLGLRILGRRADGYHELRTVFQTISLADHLELTLSRGRGLSLTVRGEAPADANNLAHRAASLAAEAWSIPGHIAVALDKRIPTGAGLGGGSTDAAAVLRALSLAAPRLPSIGAQLALARELGADVPAFLLGGTVLGLGRGDEVYPLADLERWHCTLAMPRAGAGASVATPDAFARWDRAHPQLTPAESSATLESFCSLWLQVLPAFQRSLRARNREVPAKPSRVHAGIENDFQPEVFSRSPDFPRIHRHFRRADACWVSLTGSGAAQFGLFSTAALAAGTAASLGRRDRSWATRFVSRAEHLGAVRVVS